MKKEVKIYIKSAVTDINQINKKGTPPTSEDFETEVIESTVMGTLEENEGAFLLSYKESEDNGMGQTTTELRFKKEDPMTVDMRRNGDLVSGFLFSMHSPRQEVLYRVGQMELNFTVVTRRITNCLTIEGGSLDLDYIFEYHGVPSQRTRIHIEAKVK